MNAEEYLNRVAYIEDSDIENDDGKVYLSRYDHSYLTRVGMEDSIQFLADRNIVQQVSSFDGGKVACIGFDPVKQKWYGWSHRAIFGFKVGSEVKKGDCAYSATDADDFLDDMIRFWSEPAHEKVTGHHCERDGMKGVCIEWRYSNDVPNEEIRGEIGGAFQIYPSAWGRGEWTAKTLDDARVMAMDFAEGVG
jgi:hypothetical protein